MRVEEGFGGEVDVPSVPSESRWFGGAWTRKPVGAGMRDYWEKEKAKPKSAIAAYMEKTLADLEAERKAEREREAGRKAMEARIQVLEDRLGINMPFRISDDLNEVIRYYEEKIAEREMPALEEAVEEMDLENNPEDSDEDMMEE